MHSLDGEREVPLMSTVEELSKRERSGRRSRLAGKFAMTGRTCGRSGLEGLLYLDPAAMTVPINAIETVIPKQHRICFFILQTAPFVWSWKTWLDIVTLSRLFVTGVI